MRVHACYRIRNAVCAVNACRRCWSFTRAEVGITEIDPTRPVLPEHAPDFPEYLDHAGHEGIGRGLQADLAGNAVIA
jgi:hypothetical protein